MSKVESFVKGFIVKNKSLFEDVASEYSNIRDENDVVYSILDYSKILEDMTEFIKGYIQYKDKGDDKFAGKVLGTTKSFYDSMFTDKKYRRTMNLCDMKDINKSFLEGSKKLQTLVDDCNEKAEDDHELYSLLKMTSNQYNNISKVYKDDMQIYLWLITSGSSVYNKGISAQLRAQFEDITTPVIHKNDKK